MRKRKGGQQVRVPVTRLRAEPENRRFMHEMTGRMRYNIVQRGIAIHSA